ncbi:MAG TPA: hypothetical protein VII92_12405 [Anaerolineae bacterium]
MADNASSGATARRLHIAFWIVEAGLVLFWGAVVIGIGRFTIETVGPLALWGIGVLIIGILLLLAGHEINGRWLGILIDTRNKFSLSRLQITLWTIMVLSAFFTMAMPRVGAMVGEHATLNQQQALDIRFPEELILAMGISAVSFTGANLIQSNKRSKQVKIEARSTPEAAEARRAQAKQDFDAAENNLMQLVQEESARKQELDAVTTEAARAADAAAKQLADARAARAKLLYDSVLQDKEKAAKDRDAKKKALQAADEDLAAVTAAQGLLHKNADPSEASWADFFRGEEISNYKLVDMSKVQMQFFTVVVIVTYVAALASMLSDMTTLRTAASLSFPAFSQSLNALLGISHGTYLSVKNIDHS